MANEKGVTRRGVLSTVAVLPAVGAMLKASPASPLITRTVAGPAKAGGTDSMSMSLSLSQAWGTCGAWIGDSESDYCERCQKKGWS